MIYRQGKYYLFRILRQNSTPQELAMGIALGVFIGMAVPYGLQVATMVVVALFFRRFNKIAALLGSLVTNPFTTPFLYLVYYRIGKWLVGFKGPRKEPVLIDDDTVWAMLREWGRHRDVLVAMGIAALIIAVACAVAAYFVSRPLIDRYQHRRKERLRLAFGKFMERAKALAHVPPGKTLMHLHLNRKEKGDEDGNPPPCPPGL
jgi:uncharacterized protein (DUF2062 family)